MYNTCLYNFILNFLRVLILNDPEQTIKFTKNRYLVGSWRVSCETAIAKTFLSLCLSVTLMAHIKAVQYMIYGAVIIYIFVAKIHGLISWAYQDSRNRPERKRHNRIGIPSCGK